MARPPMVRANFTERNTMKYIIFDLDDTLLNKKSQVSPYTLSVLKKLQSMGHKTVINTARSKNYSQTFFDILQPDYAIFNGGSHIVDAREQTIFKAEISHEETLDIVKALLKVTENINVQAEDGLYSHKGLYTGQKCKPFDFVQNEFPYPALKIVTRVEDDEVALSIAQKHDLAFTTYLKSHLRRYNRKGVDKASGNRKLMELVGGSLADVLAFGDDLGDVGMLQEAGVGVLMKNADPDLQNNGVQLSEYTSDQDGVAKFLAEYFRL